MFSKAGPIFWFRAASDATKWSSFGFKTSNKGIIYSKNSLKSIETGRSDYSYVFRKMCTMEYFMYIRTSPWILKCISSLNTPISQKEEHNNGCVVDKDHRFSKNKNSSFTSGKCHYCGKKKKEVDGESWREGRVGVLNHPVDWYEWTGVYDQSCVQQPAVLTCRPV